MYQTQYHTNNLNNFTFLVTKGAEFIGSNLVEYLLKYKAKKVIMLDIFSTGYLNMLVAAKDSITVKRLIYAASSSTYGDHQGLPKVEDKIGNPLSPYAVTKYVNELYADVFYKTYGLEIRTTLFFIFGPKQSSRRGV